MTDIELERVALAEHDKLVIDWWLAERVTPMYPSHVFTRGEHTDVPLLVDGTSIGTIPTYEFERLGYTAYLAILDNVLASMYK